MRFEEFQVGDYVTFEKSFESAHFERFKELSGDNNALHWNEQVGAASEFSQTIVPLALAVSPFSAVAGMALPGPASLVLSQTFNAPQPAPYGKQLTYSARVVHLRSEDLAMELSVRIFDRARCLVNGKMLVRARSLAWEDPPLIPSWLSVRRKQKRAVVTGASGAVGAAIVNALMADGWTVIEVVRERSDDGSDRLVADLRLATDRSSLAERVAQLCPELVVHCASAARAASLEELVATNYQAVKDLSEALLPSMLSKQDGRIVFLGSLAQLTQPMGLEHYVAAKEMTSHYLTGFNRRNAEHGVTAVTLLCDRTHSPFSEDMASVTGTTLEPEEVAEAVVELADAERHSIGSYALDAKGLTPLQRSQDFASDPDRRAVISSSATSQDENGKRISAKALRAVFSNVIPASWGIPDEILRLGEVPGWDSLRQIALMLEIEQTFGISFGSKDISALTTFEDIHQALEGAQRVNHEG